MGQGQAFRLPAERFAFIVQRQIGRRLRVVGIGGALQQTTEPEAGMSVGVVNARRLLFPAPGEGAVETNGAPIRRADVGPIDFSSSFFIRRLNVYSRAARRTTEQRPTITSGQMKRSWRAPPTPAAGCRRRIDNAAPEHVKTIAPPSTSAVTHQNMGGGRGIREGETRGKRSNTGATPTALSIAARAAGTSDGPARNEG